MSPNNTNLIRIGTIAKVHGYDGSVVMGTEESFAEDIPEMEWVFIEIDKKPVPFSVSSVKIHASGKIILKFDNYDSSDKMTEFIGCKVFIKDIQMEGNEDLANNMILEGYSLYDNQKNLIGPVKKIMSLPMQYMLVVEEQKHGEIMIPLNKEWIIDINQDEKTIIMDIPDGIINLNE